MTNISGDSFCSPRTARRLTGPSALALLCCAMLGLLCTQPTAEAQPSFKVAVAHAVMRPMPATIELVGTVRPQRRSTVGCEVRGLVAELPVREGDFVRAGDLICKLDDELLQLKLQSAQFHLASLQASLEAAKARLKRWSIELDRLKGLSERNRAEAKELYDAEAEFAAAEARVYEVTASINAQKANVQAAQTRLRKTHVVAPFAGHIVRLDTELGQWLSEGGPVGELLDLQTVLVRVDVPESAIAFVEVGQPSPVTIDAMSERFMGQVRHIVAQADPLARSFPADVAIENPEFRLLSGMFARAIIRSGASGEVLAVPKDAVVRKGTQTRVWVIQPAGPAGVLAVPTSVTTGAEIDAWIAILAGQVEPGVQVVTRGNERLMPFPAPVEIVEVEHLDAPARPDSADRSSSDRNTPAADSGSG